MRERLGAAQQLSTTGKAEEILFRDWDMRGAPVCARRFLSLAAYDGDDDIFSSDFSDAQLKVRGEFRVSKMRCGPDVEGHALAVSFALRLKSLSRV